MFSGLDKTKVPTGFLWDTAVNLVDGEDFNGAALTDSNYVDLPRLYDMINSINSASVWADTIPALRAIKRIQEASFGSSTTIGVLFKPYNYIVSNALQDNLISFNNQVVSDKYINGVWQNPYDESVLVGHAVGNDGVVYQSTSYLLQNVDSLSTQTFSSVQFDAGDGMGFRNVSFGSSFYVSYPAPDFYMTTLKLVSGGNTYLSHSIVKVIPTPISPQSTPSNVPETLQEVFHAVWRGKTYTASVTYEPTASFNKPFIIADAFDPRTLTFFADEDEVEPYNKAGFTNLINFKDKVTEEPHLPLQDYDLFYVDWWDCGADIRANAMLLKKIIKWINNQKTSGNANVVMGRSMGGIIARYCLCDMEINNIRHDTRLFISHDAPHLGASVSPGLQYLYWDIHDVLNTVDVLLKESDWPENTIEELKNIGSYTSVRQMLPLYVNSLGEYVNKEYDVDYRELRDSLIIMGFPKGDSGKPLENVTIVNGGNAPDGTQQFYDSGDKLLHIYADLSFDLSALLHDSFIYKWSLFRFLGGTNVEFSCNVYPFLAYSTTARSMSIIYTKSFQWSSPKTFVLVNKSNNTPSYGVLYDSISSSSFSIENSLDTLLSPLNPPSFTFDVEYELKNLRFVPTASALCYDGSFSDNFFTTNLIPKGKIPFDSYILQNESTEHISFDLDSLGRWFRGVLSEVRVPPVVFDGDTLNITGTFSFAWESSNSSVATVNNSIVHRVSDGLTDFTASWSEVGQKITKTRKAIVGYPVVSLSSRPSDSNSNVMIVRASTSNTEKDLLMKSALERGILQCKWGIKSEADPSITWRTTQYDTIHISIPDSLNYVTVYMKWKHGLAEDTTEKTLMVRRNRTFYINLDRIEFNPSTNFIAFIEDPNHSFPSISANYLLPCMMFSTVTSLSVQEITSITINDVTFPLTAMYILPQQGGSNIVVYVFDIMFNNDFMDIVESLGSTRSGVWFLRINLNDSGGTFQNIRVLCYKTNS